MSILGLETVVKDIGKVVAWPFKHAAEVVEVLTTALADEPAVKTAIVGLVKQIEAVTADGAIAVAADGINVADDVATVAAAQVLFAYVKNTFLPAVESAYKDIDSEIDTTSSTTSTTTTAAVAASVTPGPGLHTVTSA